MTELPFVGRVSTWFVFACLVVTVLLAHSTVTFSQPEALDSSPRLESVLGREVTAPMGVESGRVIDVLIDGEGHVHAFVVEFGGFLGIGTRKIAVERAAFRFSGRKILVQVLGDQIQSAREYTSGEPPYIVKAGAAPRD